MAKIRVLMAHYKSTTALIKCDNHINKYYLV